MKGEKHARSDGLDKGDDVQEETIVQDATSLAQCPISPQEERNLVIKLDRRILPILYALYFFACKSSMLHVY